MINFEVTNSSSVLPHSEPKAKFDLDLVTDQIKKALLQKDANLLEIYNRFNISNANTAFKNLLQNIELLIKEKNPQDEKNIPILNSIFSTINNQLKILESLDINKPTNDELISIIIINAILNLKRLIA